MTIELRQAIEPWHVLGEEVSGTGTARYVDSSVERLQVKVEGMIAGRHAVDVQRPGAPADAERNPGRVCRRGALSRVESALGAASDHRRARAVDLRSGRYLGGTRARRLYLPCRPSRWPQLRYVPGECQRGGGASRRAILGAWPYSRADDGRARTSQSCDADHAGFALAAVVGVFACR